MTSLELFERIISILLPQRCLICDELVEYEDYWCEKCAVPGEFPHTRYGAVECELPHSFMGALAAIEYSGPARQMILRLKNQGDRRVLQFFANEMSSVIAKYWSNVHFDLIVPVPSSTKKLKERGFNQAERLSRVLGKSIDVSIQDEALARGEDTHSQQGLSAQERRVNAKESYNIGKYAPRTAGKSILLVDDVFTTGATAAACSFKLLEAGAKSVYIITAAHQPITGSPNKDMPEI